MKSVNYNYAGSHVLVTGASRGIGYGIAEGFARAGAGLTILADDTGVQDAAARLAENYGAKVTPIQCDITDSDAVRNALADSPPIDVLINNAGLERITPLLEEGTDTEEVFRRIMDINGYGTYLVTRNAVPHMTEGGRIIMTGSIWSRTAVAEFSAYCASKHATLGLVRSLAHELGGRRINVNAVCPGWVRTDAAMLSLSKMVERTGRSEEDLLAEITGAQVLDGLLEPEDIAPLYLFLASDGAKDITGQAFTLDRGEVMA